MTSRQALTFVQIDIPVCSLTYGVAPCTASVPTTGADKCCNTKAPAAVGGCQDRANYTETEVTLTFAMPADYLPRDITSIPCIISVPEHTPGRVALGEDLGERAVLKVILKDGPHSDAGAGFDKYYATRSYNPFAQGTLFGKFRARQPFLRGRALRWYQGFVGDALADMEIRHFVVDSINGPDQSGFFTILAKDALKLLDGDRAQAPAMLTGYLSADITDADTLCTLLPAGIGITEHPVATGYGVIGGNEIVSYLHNTSNGNDADTLLYLEGEGTNGATTFTDTSSFARAISRTGNSQISNVRQKIGATSILLDGVGDSLTVPDSNDWTFAGDFTIDLYVNLVALTGSNIGDLISHAASTTARWRLYCTNTGAVVFEILNAGTLLSFTTPTGLIGSNIWRHYAVERFGNVWTLWVDGVVRATTTASVTIPNYAATLRLGLNSAGADDVWGYYDNVRISRVARYQGAAFTPPTIRYDAGDVFYITRAQLGSKASSHSAQDRFQTPLIYSGVDPAVIINDLEVNYAGMPSGLIDLPAWQNETTLFVGRTYSTIITEPTDVDLLVGELCKQVQLIHWHDDVANALRLQAVRQLPAAAIIDTSRYLMASPDVVDQPEKRVSRVQVYYGLIDPTRPISNIDNYRCNEVVIDAAAETDYGNIVIDTVFSRWIPAVGGRPLATALGNTLLARYRDAPRRFLFDDFRSDAVTLPALAGAYDIANPFLQDGYGAAANASVQVTKITAGPAVVKVEAEEMLFHSAISSDPNNHVLLIDVDTNNVNLRTLHDTLYGAPTPGITVTAIVSAGVVVGSDDVSLFALDTGSWSGITLVLNVFGTIEGKGGDGGLGAFATVNSSGSLTAHADAANGQNGGTATKFRFATSVGGNGAIKSGGGGGGGGGCGSNTGSTKNGGAGGGAAGRNVGLGAAARNDKLTKGDDGTLAAGGLGKNGTGGGYGAKGGNGGNPGVDGTNGATLGGLGFSWNFGGTKGTKGNAVDGNSFVTETGTVTFTGPRV